MDPQDRAGSKSIPSHSPESFDSADGEAAATINLPETSDAIISRFMKRHGLPQGVLSRIVASLILTGSASACNLLSNASFEEPAFTTAGSNFPPSVLNWGLVASGSPCNNGHTIVRSGSIYAGGPNAATDGLQYYQICGTSGYIFQSFSIAKPVAIRFGASFGRRDTRGEGKVVIYDATNTEPITESPLVTILTSENKETWKTSSANFAELPEGDYVLRVVLNGAASVDNVFLHTMAASGVVGGGSPAGVTEAALKCAIDVSGPTISFNGGANPITIPITSPIDVTRNLTINGGNRITLDAQAARRIFNVSTGVTLTLQNIKLVNGYSTGAGGTITNQGTIVLTNVEINNSRSLSHGGAIQNSGTLTCNNCRFDRNQAGVNGGAIDNTGTLSFTSSTASSNVAGFRGGGVYNYLGSISSFNSRYRWNRAGAYGGGVAIDAGSFYSNEDAVRGNHSSGSGGGMNLNASTPVTVVNADISLNSSSSFGGGVAGIGIETQIEGSRIFSNKGSRGGGFAVLGGITRVLRTVVAYNRNTDTTANIYNGGGGAYVEAGDCQVTGCRFVGNHTTYAGSGIMLNGNRSIFISNSIFTQGTGSFGQLGAQQNATINLVDSTVGPSNMPGIWIDGGILNLTRSTVQNNTGGFYGGGIQLRRGASASIGNSTISGNQAFNGGGIYMESGFGGSSADLVNTTLYGNGANQGGNVYIAPSSDVTFNIRNTIIGNPLSGGNCAGKIVTASSYSIASDNLCGLAGTGDRNALNPMLGPLQSNGGLTPTHHPLPGSPAIDGILGLQAPSMDQRNYPRPAGLGYDIGAVEAGASGSTSLAPPPTTTYTGVDPGDEDGDGMSDQDELMAGTDPTSSSSTLRLTRSPTNPMQFTFPSLTGRYYRVYSSLYLNIWGWTGEPTIVGDGSTKTITLGMLEGFSRRFLRVHVMDTDGPWP